MHLNKAFLSHTKGKGHSWEGIVISVNWSSFCHKPHAGFILSFPGWPGSFRKVPTFLQHTENHNVHLSQHKEDKGGWWNFLMKLLPHVFVFKDGKTQLLQGLYCFLNIKRHQNTKEPQNSRSLGTNSFMFSGLKTGWGQVFWSRPQTVITWPV